jgi:hypothetical protein
MSTFTLIHVIISLIGIVAGLAVMFDFVVGFPLGIVNKIFLLMTILTSVTGFFFPWKGFTPGIILGILSLIILALALAAMRQKWTKTYIVTAIVAEFLNVFVLINQSFQKIPALHSLAPTGKEPIVLICAVVVLVVFVVVGVVAIRKKAFLLA